MLPISGVASFQYQFPMWIGNVLELVEGAAFIAGSFLA
jgi:hypothetical protein